MYVAYMVLVSGVILGSMLAALELGRWVGRRQRRIDPDVGDSALGALDGVVFGLFGLLLAFTFFGAGSRFDQRRDLIVKEANAIETSYLRVDLLPADAQPELRALYRRYVESRIASYRKLPDLDAWWAEYDRSIALQREIWNACLAAAQRASPSPLGFVIGPLSDMMNVTTSRLASMRFHVPWPIVAMLVVLAICASVLAGRTLSASPRRSWLNVVVFGLVVAGTIYFIIDFEFPRLGVIRIDAADRMLVELLGRMR